MPLYEYQCTSCGHCFEVIQKFSDAPVRKCPKCGKAVKRLVSSSAIHFKGTGWYVTDYAKRSEPADSKTGDKAKKEPAKETTPAPSEKPEKASSSAKSSPTTK